MSKRGSDRARERQGEVTCSGMEHNTPLRLKVEYRGAGGSRTLPGIVLIINDLQPVRFFSSPIKCLFGLHHVASKNLYIINKGSENF